MQIDHRTGILKADVSSVSPSLAARNISFYVINSVDKTKSFISSNLLSLYSITSSANS